jgi:hypothetical protein
MEEDPRFPNRNDHAWEQPLFGDKPADEGPQVPEAVEDEVGPLPISGYRILGRSPENSADQPPASQPEEVLIPPPVAVIPEAVAPSLVSVSASAEEQKPAAKASIPAAPSRQVKPPFREVWLGRIRTFFSSPTRTYAAIGVGLGFLLIVIVAIAAWFMRPPEGRYDMDSVTSSAAGLKGHLYLQWDKKLEYRLTIEPSDPSQQAGFALAVNSPQRPLSIDIHLQDVEGFVLCSKQILLRYNAQGVASLDTAALSAQNAQEAAREKGRDIFQNQVGANGQVSAINAQGDIPCPAKAYEKVENWSISPNFPSLAEQAEALKRQQEMDGAALRSTGSSSAHKKATPKAPVKLLSFSVEGDDAIVEFDTSRGVIETRGRKTFFVARTGGAAANPRWQDYPVSIHFRCDRSSSCILMSPGLGDLHAKMK